MKRRERGIILRAALYAKPVALLAVLVKIEKLGQTYQSAWDRRQHRSVLKLCRNCWRHGFSGVVERGPCLPLYFLIYSLLKSVLVAKQLGGIQAQLRLGKF